MNNIYTLIFLSHISINIFAQKSLSELVYLKKVEYCFKIPNKHNQIIKNINYLINDTLFYNSFSNENVFKIENEVWYVDDWQNRFTLYYHPDSNNVAQLPYNIKEYNNENIVIFFNIKKLKPKCIDGIKVEVLGIYNSSTFDLIQTLYFTPKIGVIAYMSSGYGPTFRNNINKVIEYDRNNIKITEYDFNLKDYYKDKFNISCECK